MPIRRFAAIGLSIASLVASSSSLLAQTDANYEVPRTEYGQPDLQGVWNFSSNTPMQRNRRFGEQEFLTAEEVEAERARQARVDDAEYRHPHGSVDGRGDELREEGEDEDGDFRIGDVDDHGPSRPVDSSPRSVLTPPAPPRTSPAPGDRR